MNKPAEVAIQELKEKVIGAINESGLPAFAIDYALNDIYVQVKSLTASQTNEAIKKYKEAQNEESTDQEAVSEPA